jgi:hypothetical protein
MEVDTMTKKLVLPCAQEKSDSLTVSEAAMAPYEAQLYFSASQDSQVCSVLLSPESEERLFQFLSQRRGIAHFQQRAASDGLERSALAASLVVATNTGVIAETLAALHRTLQEFAPAAEAIIKLASYATADGLPAGQESHAGQDAGCKHGHTTYCPHGCGVVKDLPR